MRVIELQMNSASHICHELLTVFFDPSFLHVYSQLQILVVLILLACGERIISVIIAAHCSSSSLAIFRFIDGKDWKRTSQETTYT